MPQYGKSRATATATAATLNLPIVERCANTPQQSDVHGCLKMGMEPQAAATLASGPEVGTASPRAL